MSWAEKTKLLLQELIRCEFVNPTSNEEKAAKLIAKMLKDTGIETHLLHPEGYEKRLSVIARIPGKDPEAAKLGLMGHLDVVPAGNPEKWKYPPFSGIETEGFIWGRGATDCGVTVASEVMALIRLTEEGFQPEGDIILIAAADEEDLGNHGAKFLTEEHWDKVGVDYLINEGGGHPMTHSDKLTRYAFSSAEKGPFWCELTVKGNPGHASVPNSKKNTIVIV